MRARNGRPWPRPHFGPSRFPVLCRSRAPEAFRRPPLWSFQVLSSASPVTAEGAARLVVSGALCRLSSALAARRPASFCGFCGDLKKGFRRLQPPQRT
ncbi:hypothetical protein HMPREF9440_00172 [Sutterella parvirubra YIT 11816]|uniref:Uncharacterized protein n=1 Tax=Sutterella parvirubra YIT 11816 TaxID=762967 RepID=H3KBS6_9BURK|nr:hypothetical protein HMPREF9440_00172 [Sutterella parvirubra YIT 11816]